MEESPPSWPDPESDAQCAAAVGASAPVRPGFVFPVPRGRGPVPPVCAHRPWSQSVGGGCHSRPSAGAGVAGSIAAPLIDGSLSCPPARPPGKAVAFPSGGRRAVHRGGPFPQAGGAAASRGVAVGPLGSVRMVAATRARKRPRAVPGAGGREGGLPLKSSPSRRPGRRRASGAAPLQGEEGPGGSAWSPVETHTFGGLSELGSLSLWGGSSCPWRTQSLWTPSPAW